jgi:hypothetical protein
MFDRRYRSCERGRAGRRDAGALRKPNWNCLALPPGLNVALGLCCRNTGAPGPYLGGGGADELSTFRSGQMTKDPRGRSGIGRQ